MKIVPKINSKKARGSSRLSITSGWSALAGECLFDLRGPFRVWRFKTVKQAVGAYFKKLRQPGERCQGDWISAMLNMTDGFPMYANQFGEAFLGHVGFQPRLTNALAKQSQDLLIGHGT